MTLNPIVAGRSRLVIVHLPPSYHSTTPMPLVVNMHGSQSTALQQELLTGMDASADSDSFIVVYPQGGIPAGYRIRVERPRAATRRWCGGTAHRSR